MLYTKSLDSLLIRLIEDDSIIALGSSTYAENFIKKLALHINTNELMVKILPTSFKISKLLQEYKIPAADLNEDEIDLAIEFSESVDKSLNFVKTNTTSLIRDKIIASSALELIVATHLEELEKKLSRLIPVEISEFGIKKTLLLLDQFGKVRLRTKKKQPIKTESGNFLADVLIDKIHDLQDMDYELKKIPGVVETGLFFGFADKVILKKKKGYCIVES